MIPVKKVDESDSSMILTGIIVRGKQLGRTLGFPTANLQPDETFEGTRGVYAGYFCVENRKRWPCMVNIGSHPTAPEGAPTIEAHLLDFSGDLYGCRAEIVLCFFLRPEQKFPSLEALKEQLRRDREKTRALLGTDSDLSIGHCKFL